MAKKNLEAYKLPSATGGAIKDTAAGGVSAPAAAKAYYAMPEVGKDTKALYDVAAAAEKQYKASRWTYEYSANVFQEKEEALGMWTEMTLAAQDRYSRTGAASDATTLAKYREQLKNLQQQFIDAQISLNGAQADYKTKVSDYTEAVKALDRYTTEQQALYDDWKSTVRSDSVAIQAELDAVSQQLSQLQGKETAGNLIHIMGQAATAAQGGTPDYRPYQSSGDVAQQIDALTRQKALLEEELEYSRQFGYEALSENADFAAGAQAGLDQFAADKAASNQEKSGSNIWEAMLLANAKNYSASTDNPFTTQLNLVAQQYRDDTSYMEPSDKWSQKEKSTFGYLYSRNPAEAAAYAQRLNNQIAWKERNANFEKVAAAATKNGWAGIGHTLGALATAPTGLADLLDNIAEYMGRGTITQKGGTMLTPFDYSQAVIGGISDKLNDIGTIDEDVPVFGGKGLGDLYQLGYSMAQSTIYGSAGGGATLGIFFGQAGAASVDEALARGATGGQALLYGIVCGVAEAAAEYVGIEKMLNIKAASGFKGWLKNMFKQGLAEGGEEMLTSVIEKVADGIVMADKSAYSKAVQEYMKTMTKEEAEKRAFQDLLGGIVYDGLSGAASGMGHGVFMTGAQTIKANNALKKLGWDKLTMEDVREIVDSGLESAQDTDAYKLALELRELLDAGEMPSKTDIVRQIQANDKAIWAEEKEAESQAVGNEEQKTYFSMEDYANSESPVWNNVAYDDDETKAAITQQTHADMVNAGAVVAVSADVMQKVEQELPDLRSVKKNERTPILKAAFKALKNNLRQFLSGLSGQKFEFSVNGSVLEAKLYSTGINEVLEKITKQKANMLYTTEDIFRNARYLYSTEDYGGDPNVYRWNYFYTPVQIGNDTVGVRIAVRDMVKGVGMLPESQIYNWGIKKDASLDGGRRGPKVASSDVSSDASNAIIDQGGGIVNNERNGGNENAESTGAGDRVSDGVGQRQNGMGTGKPTGSMAGRSGGAEGWNAQADARRTAINRQNRAKDLIRQGLIQKISSRELGLKNGTDAQNIAVLPQEYWDEELQQIAKEVMEETGREVTFVVGGMEIRSGRLTRITRGIRSSDLFIVQVDNMKATARQIAEHELFHEIVHQKLLLIPQMQIQVAQSCTKEELDAVVGRYWEDMAKTMETTADTDLDRLLWKVEMEVYADAYAGIDYKGFGATQFTESVRQYAQQESQRRTKWQANGVRQTNGPNAAQENTALDDGVQYSMDETEVQGIQSIGKVSVNKFGTAEIQRTERLARRYWSEMGTKSPFFRAWFGDWRANDQTPVQVADQKDNTRGVQKNADTGWDIQVSGKVFAESGHFANRNTTAVPYLDYIDDIVRKAVLLDTFGIDAGKAKSQNSLLMHSMYAVADIGNGPELLKLYVEEMNNPANVNTAKRAYQLQNIEKASAVNGGVQSNAPSSLANTTNAIRTVADLFAAVKAKDSQFNPKPASKVVNTDGTPMIVYHGTSDRFTEFKHSEISDKEGSFFFAQNREDAEAYTGNGRVMEVYVNLQNPIDYNDMPSEIYRLRDKKAQVAALKKLGYDGWMCDMDTGWGEVSAFYANQIKSATDNIGTFDESDDDIQYSMDEGEVSRIDGEMAAEMKRWENMYLENRLGKEGAKEYRSAKAQHEEQRKAEAKAKDKAKRREQAEQRRHQAKERDEMVDAAMNAKLKEGAKPTQAKKELRMALLDQFSIPAGSRAEIAELIDSMADRMIREGALTEDLRKTFFDRLYAAGVMTVPADEYMAIGREIVNKGKIYVDEHIRTELGDDWSELRRRAFGAGVYLTTDRADAGIDQWNHELAEMLPGLFDAEATDMREVLERIVDVAEEGKSEQVSLPEYTAQLAGAYQVSVDEVLDKMERDMDTVLRVFARTAGMEIKLKEQGIRERAALTKENMRQRWQLAQERQERKEKARQAQEQKELQEMQQKTLKALQWLNKNRWRAPEELKATFDEALSDIDIYAVGAANEVRWSDKYGATWKDLAQMYLTAKDTDPNFMPSKELEMIVSRLNDQKIADMDLGALNDLYKAAVGLRTEFYNRNNVISDEMHRLFEEVYTDSKAEMKAASGGYTGKLMDRLFNMEQLTAMNVLHRMSGWNPNSAWYSMAKQLERGERDVRAFTVKANRMLEEFLTEHEDWVKKADGQGKDAVWYTIEVPELMELGMGDKPIFGDAVTVYMTPAQKVHMYLESKNQDNLRHMMGGRTFANKELYSKGERKEAFAQGTTIRMAPETVKQIVSDLTAEEMELAQILEKFYNEFSKGEINRVSNVLYGYDKAMGKNYAPIFTNQNYVQSEIGIFDQTAEGVGNMKGRIPYSKNPSYNIGAFDAFERNVDQTARFVGLSIPMRNWNTLLNWRENKDSMGDVITHQWGEESKKYIENLLAELQSGKVVQKDIVSENVEKLMSNYISSVFGANPSIVLKQLGSIPLAGVYLGGKNVPNLKQIWNIDRQIIGKYTQDLDWRSMGYSMPETKQLKDNPNWTQTNKFMKFAFGGGAITAMDTWAASTLWPWAENKVRKEHPELELGTREQVEAGQSPFYKKVAEEFENALARSQSTSDQMHQGTLRKSKNPLARMFTMFRSDSAQTYNALRQMIGEAQYAKKNGTKEEARKAARKVGTVVLAALGNFVMAEVVNLAMAMVKNKGKAYRDDEEELTAQSILEQVGINMLKGYAGIFVGGEELADLIGSVLTGEKWYEAESMEVSLIQDLMSLAHGALEGTRDLIAEGINVAANGGDLLEYFRRHGNDLLGNLKDAAADVAGFLGVPASNVEAYLVGLLKFIPGFEAAYDDVFATATKSGLAGVEGADLAVRMGHILGNRGISGSKETTQALADLYEAGFTGAAPSNTPTSVTIDGESHKLSAYQQQVYDKAWAESVSAELDTVVKSVVFQSAEPEKKEKMLKTLYSYAADEAKAELFEEFEGSSRADDVVAFREAGLEMADYLSAVADGHDPEKFLEAVDNGLSTEDAGALMDNIEELEPEEGRVQVADVQRWRQCVDMWNNPASQLAALATYMEPEQIKKARTADLMDVDLSNYVKLYEIRAQFDANGNKSFSQTEYKAAIDSMKLSKSESAVLWQLATGAKSAKNNPYSTSVGERVLELMG